MLSDCFLVEIGGADKVYPLISNVDLTRRTSVADLLDIATVCDAMVGQCSFMVPLAECFDKPLMAVWAARGLQSNVLFLKQCTPQKILSKPSSHFVMDDWSKEVLEESARQWHGSFCSTV